MVPQSGSSEPRDMWWGLDQGGGFSTRLWGMIIKCWAAVNVEYSGVDVLVLQMGEYCVQDGWYCIFCGAVEAVGLVWFGFGSNSCSKAGCDIQFNELVKALHHNGKQDTTIFFATGITAHSLSTQPWVLSGPATFLCVNRGKGSPCLLESDGEVWLSRWRREPLYSFQFGRMLGNVQRSGLTYLFEWCCCYPLSAHTAEYSSGKS